MTGGRMAAGASFQRPGPVDDHSGHRHDRSGRGPLGQDRVQGFPISEDTILICAKKRCVPLSACTVFALVLFLVLGTCHSKDVPPSSLLAEECDVAPEHRDFSQFQKFHLDTRHVFDVSLGDLAYNVVDSASVTREDDGRYLLELTILESGRCGVDECIWQDEPEVTGCPVLRSPASRYLDNEEVEWLEDAFARVNVCADSSVYCTRAFPEPGAIVTLTWDDFSASTYPCDDIPSLDYTQVADIQRLLRNLGLSD